MSEQTVPRAPATPTGRDGGGADPPVLADDTVGRPPGARMEVVSGLAALTRDYGRLFVVVGVFDGLHRGHLYLIRHLRREALRRRARPAVITFDAHPDEILVGSAPPLLCDPEERLVRLERAGVEATIVWPFDVSVRMTTYDRWIDSIRERVDLAGFLMTPDAAFGFQRGGTPEAVAEHGRLVDPPYDVAVVPPLELDGRPVRSGEIRSDVAAGDLAGARRLLGRALSVVGDARPASAAVHISFPIPVALPPVGRYRSIVEPAWTETAGVLGLEVRRRGIATVESSGEVQVTCRSGVPGSPRLRVSFLSRLD